MANASADITTRSPLVHFTDRFVPPPSTLYITRDDRLWCQLAMSAGPGLAIVSARVLTPAGEVVYWQQTMRAGSARVATLSTFELLEGFLLGISVAQVAPQAASDWAYAVLGLTREESGLGSISQVFAKGYFSFFYPLQWPGGTQQNPGDGKGVLRREVGADPAAGAEFALAVPPAARWKPLALDVELVTSATVATRRITLRAMRAGAQLWRSVCAVTQIASLTRQYIGGHWGEVDLLRGTAISVNIPAGVELLAGDTLGSLTAAIQVGDNYGAPALYVEEWYLAP